MLPVTEYSEACHVTIFFPQATQHLHGGPARHGQEGTHQRQSHHSCQQSLRITRSVHIYYAKTTVNGTTQCRAQHSVRVGHLLLRVSDALAVSLTRRKVLGSPSKDVEDEDGGEQNYQEGGEPRPHQPHSQGEHAGHTCTLFFS